MLTLYHYECCPYCVRVRMMLAFSALPYELKTLHYDDKTTTQRLASTNLTPILVREDGRSITESLVIVADLEAQSGHSLDPRAMPASIVQALDATEEVRASLMKPRLLSLGLDEFATPSSQTYFYERWSLTPALMQQELERTSEYVERVAPALQHISDTVAAERWLDRDLAMADILLAPVLRSLTSVKALRWPAPLEAYLRRRLEEADVAPLPSI